VNEPIFRDEVNDTVLLGNLHGDREVVGGLGREVDVDSFLDKGRVWRRMIDLNDMELRRGV
jgi:hypothetical protein